MRFHVVEFLVKIMSRILSTLWVGRREAILWKCRENGIELVCEVFKRIWRMIDPNNIKFPRCLNSDNMEFKSRDPNFKKRRMTVYSGRSEKQTCTQSKPEVPLVW